MCAGLFGVYFTWSVWPGFFRARLLLVDDLDARLARHDDGVGHVEEEAVLHHAHHLGDLFWLFVGVGVCLWGGWDWGHGCVCGIGMGNKHTNPPTEDGRNKTARNRTPLLTSLAAWLASLMGFSK